MEQLPELRLGIHSFQMRIDPEQSRLLAQLRSIETLQLDYVLLDLDMPPGDFVDLAPIKFNKLHTLNVTVQYHDVDNFTQVQQYYDQLRPRVKYTVNVNDCLISRYMGRHHHRYFAEFEE